MRGVGLACAGLGRVHRGAPCPIRARAHVLQRVGREDPVTSTRGCPWSSSGRCEPTSRLRGRFSGARLRAPRDTAKEATGARALARQARPMRMGAGARGARGRRGRTAEGADDAALLRRRRQRIAQDLYGVWYDAEKLRRELGERAGARAVLVHWAGGEDHWDEFSPRRDDGAARRGRRRPARTPASSSRPRRSAAREQALEANDMWQFNMFVGGTARPHIGYCQSYVVAEPGGSRRLARRRGRLDPAAAAPVALVASGRPVGAVVTIARLAATRPALRAARTTVGARASSGASTAAATRAHARARARSARATSGAGRPRARSATTTRTRPRRPRRARRPRARAVAARLGRRGVDRRRSPLATRAQPPAAGRRARATSCARAAAEARARRGARGRGRRSGAPRPPLEEAAAARGRVARRPHRSSRTRSFVLASRRARSSAAARRAPRRVLPRAHRRRARGRVAAEVIWSTSSRSIGAPPERGREPPALAARSCVFTTRTVRWFVLELGEARAKASVERRARRAKARARAHLRASPGFWPAPRGT